MRQRIRSHPCPRRAVRVGLPVRFIDSAESRCAWLPAARLTAGAMFGHSDRHALAWRPCGREREGEGNEPGAARKHRLPRRMMRLDASKASSDTGDGRGPASAGPSSTGRPRAQLKR
jgi:hypothetical protein